MGRNEQEISHRYIYQRPGDIKVECKLIEFASKATKELKNTVKKTKNACVEFCRRVLLTYNWCQTSATKRLEVLPEHEMFLKQLQER